MPDQARSVMSGHSSPRNETVEAEMPAWLKKQLDRLEDKYPQGGPDMVANLRKEPWREWTHEFSDIVTHGLQALSTLLTRTFLRPMTCGSQVCLGLPSAVLAQHAADNCAPLQQEMLQHNVNHVVERAFDKKPWTSPFRQDTEVRERMPQQHSSFL